MENNNLFHEVFEKLAKSHTTLPCETLLGILSGIVTTSDKDHPDVKKLAQDLGDGLTKEEIISRSILCTCNSIIMNIWRMFGKQIEEAYKANNKDDSKAGEA